MRKSEQRAQGSARHRTSSQWELTVTLSIINQISGDHSTSFFLTTATLYGMNTIHLTSLLLQNIKLFLVL